MMYLYRISLVRSGEKPNATYDSFTVACEGFEDALKLARKHIKEEYREPVEISEMDFLENINVWELDKE